MMCLERESKISLLSIIINNNYIINKQKKYN